MLLVYGKCLFCKKEMYSLDVACSRCKDEALFSSLEEKSEA